MLTFIGEYPGPHSDVGRPLWPEGPGSTGRRLMELMGLTEIEYLALTCRVNLLTTSKTADTPDGFADWDAYAHLQARQAMGSGLYRGHDVVLIGPKVMEAFYPGLDFDYCQWVPGNPMTWYARLMVIPTPSNRTKEWRVTAVKKMTADLLYRAVRGLSATVAEGEI